MDGDKLVIELDTGRFAVDTRLIAGIVEMENIPFLPGQTGFVSGIISLRNEPVTVVNLRTAIGDFTGGSALRHKVVVLRDSTRLIGLDIEEAEVTFIWDDASTGRTTAEKGLYTSGRIYTEGEPIDIIDWSAIFNETSRILSSEGHV